MDSGRTPSLPRNRTKPWRTLAIAPPADISFMSVSLLLLRPRVRRFGSVFRRPLLGERRQSHFLAGHALDRNCVNGNHVNAREEAFRPAGIRLAVFRHQRLAETLLGGSVLNDSYFAEQDHASVRQP